MRKMFIIILAMLLIAGSVSEGWCGAGPTRKLERGLCNVLTFYIEIYNRIEKTAVKSTMFDGVTTGLAKGVYMSGFRLLTGVYELLTFPFPGHNGFAPIINDPEFLLGSPDADDGDVKVK